MRHKTLKAVACCFVLISDGAGAQIRTTSPSCEKRDASFKEFLSRFANDKSFQSNRLVLPLVSRTGDNVTTGMTIELWNLARVKSLKYPLIYSDRERKQQDLVQSITLLQSRRAEVFQQQREADAIRLLYKFENFEGCWFLMELDDFGM